MNACLSACLYSMDLKTLLFFFLVSVIPTGTQGITKSYWTKNLAQHFSLEHSNTRQLNRCLTTSMPQRQKKSISLLISIFLRYKKNTCLPISLLIRISRKRTFCQITSENLLLPIFPLISTFRGKGRSFEFTLKKSLFPISPLISIFQEILRFFRSL